MRKKEIVERLREQNSSELLIEADNIRQSFCGDSVHLRGIIELSNYCCHSCLYCGLRKENKKIQRYRMIPEEAIRLAYEIIECGIRTVVLQSGDDFGYSQNMISQIIKKIKEKDPEVAITLCVGERLFEDYKAWKEAGADRYLLRHETANPELYEKLHPGQTLKKRLKILEYLRELGYQIGAGNIVGLPGGTFEDLSEDIMLLRDFEVDMAGIGPFIPQRDTPLADYPSGDLELTLKVLALTRIITQNTHLPATTALATLDPEKGLLLGLGSGANVIMPDFTPENYRKNYTIYDNKVRVNLEKAKETISKSGRIISKSRGDSLKCKKHQKACVST